MARRAFRIGGWTALVLGILTALSAATVLAIGALALAGRLTYPVTISVGPFSFQDKVTMPVVAWQEVCQKASTKDTALPSDCLRYFLHGGEDWEALDGGKVHVQDADVRPTDLYLTGAFDLATTGGWTPLVAASVARKAVGLMAISGMLLLLWRLLANSAAGEVFSARAVRQVRGIGWLLIADTLADVVLHIVVNNAGEYSPVHFGYEIYVEQAKDIDINVAQLAFGVLVLLLAEVFRHGATVEDEYRLTV